jgi:Domain of unknown function (DUF397)
MEDTVDPRWRKASYSGNGGASCVEVGQSGATVLVRDTKDRVGAVLAFGSQAWRVFAGRVKDNEAV